MTAFHKFLQRYKRTVASLSFTKNMLLIVIFLPSSSERGGLILTLRLWRSGKMPKYRQGMKINMPANLLG